jgi:fructokinase
MYSVESHDTGWNGRGAGPLDHRVIRRHNGKRILDAVRRHGPISRAALAHRAELSAPTVSALVDDLVDRRGLLRNVGKGASSGGRRPLMVDFNADYGIDIGSRILRFVLADLRGRVVHRREERTPTTARQAILNAITSGVRALFTDADVDKAKLFAIGAGAPGMTDVTKGRVISAVNLKGWTDVPLRELLQDEFGVPAFVDNDVNMAALGEQWVGCARDCKNFVFIALGAGVGAGIVIDGRILDGPRGIGGEWGHNPLPWAAADEVPGPLCWCGRRGCMETWVSGPALAATYLGGGGNTSDSEEIVRRAAAGEDRARIALARHADRLARGLAQIVNIIDPDAIVLGGGLSRLAHLYADLPALMAPHIFSVDTRVDIRPPRWGDASGARGAAWLWEGEVA